MQREDISPLRYLLYEVIKKVLLAVEYFTTKRMMDSAAALTYSTLLAIVPIMAVVFAIARGFGYNKYIETWFRERNDSLADFHYNAGVAYMNQAFIIQRDQKMNAKTRKKVSEKYNKAKNYIERYRLLAMIQ